MGPGIDLGLEDITSRAIDRSPGMHNIQITGVRCSSDLLGWCRDHSQENLQTSPALICVVQ